MIDIPNSADEITAAWLAAALAANGHDLPAIESMERQRIGEGFGALSEIYRLTPRYAKGGDGPKSLIVKIAPPIQPVRDLAGAYGLYQREVTFYRDLASTVPMRSPACYATAFNPANQDFVLVLEDICDATGGDQIGGMPLEQVRVAIDALADLHVAWWGRPELKALESVIQPFGVAPYCDFNVRHGGAWAVIEPFMKERVSPRMMRVGERLGASLDGMIEQVFDGPRTLCHGDFRGDNLMFETHPDGGLGLIVLDWQILTQGSGAFDLGYMMSGSVATEVRRDHEMDLLRGYHDKLLAGGVTGYDFDQCLRDYRRALLIGFTYCVQGGAPNDLTIPRMEALFTAMALRCQAAVEDHGLEEFLA